MKNRILAPRGGQITQILVLEGEIVPQDHPLIKIES